MRRRSPGSATPRRWARCSTGRRHKGERTMASWRRAFRLHLRGGTVEQDVDDEIAFHLEMRERELIEDGMEPAAAREEARRYFGEVEGVRRRCREIGRQTVRGRRWTEVLAELRHDAVFALRQLRKTPGFTLVAV